VLLLLSCTCHWVRMYEARLCAHACMCFLLHLYARVLLAWRVTLLLCPITPAVLLCRPIIPAGATAGASAGQQHAAHAAAKMAHAQQQEQRATCEPKAADDAHNDQNGAAQRWAELAATMDTRPVLQALAAGAMAAAAAPATMTAGSSPPVQQWTALEDAARCWLHRELTQLPAGTVVCAVAALPAPAMASSAGLLLAPAAAVEGGRDSAAAGSPTGAAAAAAAAPGGGGGLAVCRMLLDHHSVEQQQGGCSSPSRWAPLLVLLPPPGGGDAGSTAAAAVPCDDDVSSSADRRGGAAQLSAELQAILDDSAASMVAAESTPREAWWRQRLRLDARMAALLSRLDGEWLGPWRCLLAAPPPPAACAAAAAAAQGFLNECFDFVDGACALPGC
jgi:Peptidase family C50